MSTDHTQATRAPQNIALFGGSFDPIHRGHRLIAEAALEQGGVDEVWFIPAARSPFKDQQPVASDADRLAMISAAISANPRFRLWDGELKMPPPSYSLRTVETIQKSAPKATLHWLLGADQFSQLHKWWNAEQLAKAVRFLVCVRPGSEITPPPIKQLSWQAIQNPPIELSSSDIRRRIQSRMAVDNCLDPDVLKWLKHKQLYRY